MRLIVDQWALGRRRRREPRRPAIRRTHGWSAWPAPAKLNLFLRITGRRDDGYHLLQTVFRLLDWGDTIRLRVRDDGQIRPPWRRRCRAWPRPTT